MAYLSLGSAPLPWPIPPSAVQSSAQTILDASGEIVAYCGQIVWSDLGSHTIDTSGSSAIYVHTGGTAVFDDAGSIMHIGIQDLDVTTGLPVRPDGTFDVHAVVTTAADTTPALTTLNSLVRAVPTTGTKTMATGAQIAVVMDFNTRAGSDSVGFMRSSQSYGAGSTNAQAFPVVVTNITATWAFGSGLPFVLLRASDGTWGRIEGCDAMGTYISSPTFSDSSNPDEYGMIFQVPFDCKVSGFTMPVNNFTTTSDFQYDLTSTPTGTPASLISGPIAMNAENTGPTGSSGATLNVRFASLVSLTANTDYCISVKATGAGSIGMYRYTLPDAGARALLPGGTTTFGATRNGGSGAYTTSTTVMNQIAVIIAEIGTAGAAPSASEHFSAFVG